MREFLQSVDGTFFALDCVDAVNFEKDRYICTLRDGSLEATFSLTVSRLGYESVKGLSAVERSAPNSLCEGFTFVSPIFNFCHQLEEPIKLETAIDLADGPRQLGVSIGIKMSGSDAVYDGDVQFPSIEEFAKHVDGLD